MILAQERGESAVKKFSIPVLVIIFIVTIAGVSLLGGCNRKQTVITPPPVEQEKEDAAARLAAADKIAGYAHPEALISVYELNEKIFDPATLIFDTRGRTNRIYQKSYPLGHIPGAIPILYSQYYHPVYVGRIAPPLQLQDVLGKSGVSNNTNIVLYGNDGLQARLYWAVKMYGYESVKILDGGLDKWKESGYDIATVQSKRPAAAFEFDLTKSKAELMLATLNEVEASIGSGNCVIVDARSTEEFIKGHIPGSVNVEWSLLLNKDMTFKSAPDLKQLFEGKKIAKDKKVIVYANDGVLSSLVWFALSELLGYPDVKNYDGSLNEWLQYQRQVEKGP